MNCTRCPSGVKAVIGLPRHNAAFCKGCFTGFVHEQVARAIKSQRMFSKDDRILVAVSGGKDSLALWHILLQLGYRADALYVNLGIGGYSELSRQKVQRYADTVAAAQGATLLFHAVEQQEGAGIKELANLLHRPLSVQSRGRGTGLRRHGHRA
jgi:3'-phosphoadenosine 5'-phosphosulfate sulfotransferase (PAPS reductase)/FAD synthetase